MRTEAQRRHNKSGVYKAGGKAIKRGLNSSFFMSVPILLTYLLLNLYNILLV